MEESEAKINKDDWTIFGINTEDLTEEFKWQTQNDQKEVIDNMQDKDLHSIFNLEDLSEEITDVFDWALHILGYKDENN